MNSFEALELLKNGKLIRKKGWNKDEYIYSRCGLIFNKNHKIYNIELPSSLTDPFIWEEYIKRVPWTFKVGSELYSDYAASSVLTYEKYIVEEIGEKSGEEYIKVINHSNYYFFLFKKLYMNYEFNILI